MRLWRIIEGNLDNLSDLQINSFRLCESGGYEDAESSRMQLSMYRINAIRDFTVSFVGDTFGEGR